MLTLDVRLYGALRRYRPGDVPGEPHQPFAITLTNQATVESLGRQLGIPDGFISAAAINDEAVESDAVLQDGDRVSLFPPSAGGQDHEWTLSP